MSQDRSRVRPELSEPRLRALYDYWNHKCRDRSMPARADLDPVEMRPWLGNLALIDVTADRGFVYRLYGTAFVDSFGVDMTGRGIDELPAEQRDRVYADYESVREAGQPRARLYTALFEATPTGLRPPAASAARTPQVVTWERLVLPLCGGGDVAMLLVGAYPLADLRPST
jgi:hypothetical protein